MKPRGSFGSPLFCAFSMGGGFDRCRLSGRGVTDRREAGGDRRRALLVSKLRHFLGVPRCASGLSDEDASGAGVSRLHRGSAWPIEWQETDKAGEVVFSFFKKDAKDGKDRPGDQNAGRSRGVSKPIGKPLDGPVKRSGRTSTEAVPSDAVLPEKEQARALAMKTAAKIDAIESEMARDFLRPGGTSTQVFASSAANSTLQKATQLVPVGEGGEPTQPPLEFYNTDILNGDALAIEVGAADGNAVLDETAILFANGQSDPAEAMLRGAIESSLLGGSVRQAWRLLLELVQQRGDRSQYETLAVDYALQFGDPALPWLEYPVDRPVAPPLTESVPVAAKPSEPGSVRLPAVLDAGVVAPLEQLKSLSQQYARLTLDVSDAQSIDTVGAELLLRVINAFKRASHELVIVGPEALLAPLHAAIEPGRRDPSDSAWMLLIEVYRLLDEQHEFEEAAIQYCITFEVSPPSWEPSPANFHTRPAERSVVVSVAPAVPVVAPCGLQWRGTLVRDGEPSFGQLLAALQAGDQPLVVDCTYLRRVEFTAASNLLSVLTRVTQAGAQVELRGLNTLVAQLFNLLGVGAFATLSLRSA
ncbi:MAG: STAS domain-containing protein [Burkholderiaceae bacterium]